MKTEEIKKEMMESIMYASMDESDFWATSTISPKEASEEAKAWETIYNLRLKSERKQKEFSKKFALQEKAE